MDEDRIKLPRSSYDELIKIIKAYGKLSEPSSLKDVNDLAGVGTTCVSANNAFLTFIGLIEGGQKKSPTEICVKLAQALEHNIHEEIQNKWHDIVEKNNFLTKMSLAVKIRKEMDRSSLESHIAYTAGEQKSKEVMTGSRAVIDILEIAGYLEENNGKISHSNILTNQDSASIVKANNLSDNTPKRKVSEEGKIINPKNEYHINIQIQIIVKPEEITQIGKSIKRMLKDLSDEEEISGEKK